MTSQKQPRRGGKPQHVESDELRLPRAPGVFRRWLAAHPKLVDWVIVASYLFGCALMLSAEAVLVLTQGSGFEANTAPPTEVTMFGALLAWPWLAVRVVITLVGATALLWRRRAAHWGAVAVASLMLLNQGLLVVPNLVALVFLIYAAPAYLGVLRGWLSYVFVVVVSAAQLLVSGSAYTGLLGPSGLSFAGPITMQDSLLLSALNALWLLAVLMFGMNVGNRQRYVDALIDRARQLAVEREQRAQLAVANERSRIAREMHDIVAHSLSVVVTLSEAAAVSIDAQPDAARAAMERAAETGRGALTEMRRLLGVLNGGEAPTLAPQPGLEQLAELVEGFREAGLAVVLTESGSEHGDATHQVAVFRIVQEGLTNALRYAGPGARAHVTIDHGATATSISVVDQGRPMALAPDRAGAASPIPGTGQGLVGARQRAELFGGSLRAGPEGSGWCLRATVPLRGTNEREQESLA